MAIYAAKASRANWFFLTIGWISAIISVAFYPLIFGILGVIMGILASKGGSKRGVAVIVTSIILMGIGFIYGGVILNYFRHYTGI